MKALITGGAGFIGSHIAEALVRRGDDVVVLDDLSAGTLLNLAWSKGSPNIQFTKGSIIDAKLVRHLMAGCDWVFHEAAITSVPHSVRDPLGSNSVNLEATLGLLQAARETGVKRFLFASSAAVYGESEALPKREDFPVAPISPYGLQKYAAERYAQLFHRHYGLETVCFRYFNVFGPRQAFDSPYSGVIARFCGAALNQAPVTVFGDGQQTRDFVYIDNVVAANVAAAGEPASQVAGKVFNVGGGQSVSLLDLLDELGRLCGTRLEARFEPPRPGDIRHSAADIAAISQAIGCTPRIDWREGLRRTFEWHPSS